jgi:hypothetical protein
MFCVSYSCEVLEPVRSGRLHGIRRALLLNGLTETTNSAPTMRSAKFGLRAYLHRRTANAPKCRYGALEVRVKYDGHKAG